MKSISVNSEHQKCSSVDFVGLKMTKNQNSDPHKIVKKAILEALSLLKNWFHVKSGKSLTFNVHSSAKCLHSVKITKILFFKRQFSWK